MTAIHIVGVSGSPRDQGTEAALEYALEKMQSMENVTVDQINLRELEFKFCIHCDRCLKPDYFQESGHRCYHNDDLEKIYPRILKADGFLFATPVYTGNPSGLLWSFLNRLRPINHSIADKNKTMQFITVGGSHRNGTDFATMALLRIVVHAKYIYVPSGIRECIGVQLISRNPSGSQLSSGREGVLSDAIGIKSIDEMVPRMIKFTKLIKAGEAALGIQH